MQKHKIIFISFIKKINFTINKNCMSSFHYSEMLRSDIVLKMTTKMTRVKWRNSQRWEWFDGLTHDICNHKGSDVWMMQEPPGVGFHQTYVLSHAQKACNSGSIHGHVDPAIGFGASLFPVTFPVFNASVSL